MKKLWSKLSELQKMLLLASIVGLVFILASIIGVIFGQWGWMIGVSLGTLVELLNLFFLYKGSEMALKNSKTALFLTMYFVRMMLYAGGLILLVLLQFTWKVSVFNNSFWGYLIGITPMQLVVIIVMARSGKSPLDIAKKEEN